MPSFGQTYNVGASDGTGWRKLDLMDRIIDQDPRATPFFEITGMCEARNTLHQWQVRGVPARAANVNLEGFAFAGQEVDIPSRVTNTCQILDTPVEVTRTSQREMHYGTSDIWQDQINHFTYVHRGDTEFALLKNNVSGGATDEERSMNGLINTISTNASDQAILAFSETMFINAVELSWNNQDAPMLDMFCNSNIKKGVDAFSSLSAVRNMEVRTRDVVHNVSKYFSSFGEVDIHLSRDMNNVNTTASPENDFALFDRRQMKKAYLDRTHLQPSAKVKDADTLIIISELTLEYGNEKGAVYFNDIHVSL